MPRLITATKVARRMSKNAENEESTLLDILTQPSNTLANWYVAIGTLGLFLAILNITGQIHPTQRLSWGGLFTFEMTNAAFGDKTTAAAFVAGDAVFMALCAGLLFLGVRSLSGDETPAEWAKSLVSECNCYNDLVSTENGGWNGTLGAWSIVASLGFYFYWGAMHMAWIDPCVYSIAIALMGVGLVLRMLSTVESDE